MSKLTREFLYDQYITKGKSMSQIAMEYGFSYTKIRNAMIKSGIAIKTHAAAQSEAIERNRARCPTLGRRRTEEEKSKISQGSSDFWKSEKGGELKEKFSDASKKQWEKRRDKEQFMEKSFKSNRATIEKGSKLERFLFIELKKLKIDTRFHFNKLLSNQKLQVDLFLPEFNLVVEIDGISHFQPIFGEEKLEQTQNSDREKNALLLTNGFWIIRVLYKYRLFTLMNAQVILKKLIAEIENIKAGTTQKLDEKLIYIEVSENNEIR